MQNIYFLIHTIVKREKNEYGQFLGFEPLTYVPFDRSLIDTEGMNKEEPFSESKKNQC